MIQYKDGSRKILNRSDIAGQLEKAESTLKVPQSILDDDIDDGAFEKEVEEYSRQYNADIKRRANMVPASHKAFDNFSKNNGGCYIATCVYGSYACPEVWTLRRYRDFTLARSMTGRQFIKIYYAISPKLVKRFGHRNWFKKICQRFLDQMVKRLHNEGFSDTPYYDR